MKKRFTPTGRLIVLSLMIVGLINQIAVLAPAGNMARRTDKPRAGTRATAAESLRPFGVVPPPQRLHRQYDNLPLRFEAVAPAEFIARDGAYNVRLTASEARVVPRPSETADERSVASPDRDPLAARRRPPAEGIGWRLVGARPAARVTGEAQLPTRSNYFIGKDAARWRTDVANYARVKVEQVYRGIDVVYYGAGRQLEYDFDVAPGASFKAIRLRFDGARSLQVDGTGDLVIETAAGRLRHHRPLAYQQVDGARQAVAARYRINRRREVEFIVEGYDKRLPLVIDPVLSYSTYFGGRDLDRIYGMAVDTSGNVYITGTTSSSDLPVKAAFQPSHAEASRVAFVAKLNAEGTELIYSTYLGGSFADEGKAIAVDAAGNVYVTGTSYSNDFPTTAGALKPAHPGGHNSEAFVAKLSADGSALVYSTYLGGVHSQFAFDYGTAIAVDPSGNAYVTGQTDANDFPTTPGALQPALKQTDAFVSKLNAEGSALLYSTYLGGSGYEAGQAITLDGAGNAYVTGYTVSVDFPVTPGAAQPGHSNPGASPPTEDAFVVKLNAEGTALVYSTFLGGVGTERGNAIAIDAAGNAYVAGQTDSSDFPTSAGGLKRTFGGGFYKSGNGGRRWQAGNTGLPSLTPRAFAADPRVAGHFYLTTGDGLYTTTDAGASWRSLGQPRLYYLVIDPLTPSTLYGYGIGVGILKSTDGGVTWMTLGGGLPTLLYISQVLIDPQHPATLYAAGMGTFVLNNRRAAAAGQSAARPLAEPPPPPPTRYFFKSTDGGATWHEVVLPVSLPPSALAMDPQDPARLFININGQIYRTQNGGASWQLRSTQAFYAPLVVDPKTSGTLYGGNYSGSDGVVKSTDDGQTWTEIKAGLPTPLFLQQLLAVPGDQTTLYAGTDDGLFKSADGGGHWQAAGITGNIAFVAANPQNPAAVYTGTLDPRDAFVVKLNATGSALQYATYLGGQSGDEASAIAVDQAGNAYVTGLTYSSDFPIQNALLPTRLRPAIFSAFLAKLNPTGNALSFSTYFGGSKDVTDGRAVAISAAGDIFVAGSTATPDIPAKNATQSAFSGEVDGFLFKLGAPRISGVSLSGKHLVVAGENFDAGALVLVNGEPQKTEADAANANARLIGKKAGKHIAVGQPVKVQVRNQDGTLSNEFTFTRPSL